MNTRTLKRTLVALLLTLFLAAWVAPASAQEAEVPPTGTVAPEPTTGDVVDDTDASGETEDDGTVDDGAEDGTGEQPVTPVDPGTTEPDGTVTGAVLRWGLNHESNNRAFAPGTFNFFRAGKLPNPGKGGTTITEPQWTGTEGNVSIQKWNGSAYQPATWAGLSTDETGTTIPSATSGKFSGHQIVFGNGTGTVDPNAGTMSLAWDGDATVVYYSGMTFFYLSDPTLEVTGGKGSLTAELSGFASSMEDLTQWVEIAPRRVEIATFSQATVTPDGVFQATPDYAGVINGQPDQVTSGPDVGSFPVDFVNFQKTAGAASYWYSSGGSADRFKAALPVTVLVDPSMLPPAPVVPVATSSAPPTNTALAPPPRRSAPSPRAVAPVVAPLAAQTSVQEAAAYQSAGDHGWMLGQTPVSDQVVWWLLAAALTTMAASTVTASAVYVRRLRPTP